jgi:predicted nucleic-acid-binding protein
VDCIVLTFLVVYELTETVCVQFSYETPDLPDEFIFEYSIDGVITSLSKTDFLEKKQQLQRVVETVTLLDDEGFTSEPKDVEVAIRLRGCGRKCTFGVSHIYWA